jgi:D-sedoheptulose 7-phosphate isomerase
MSRDRTSLQLTSTSRVGENRVLKAIEEAIGIRQKMMADVHFLRLIEEVSGEIVRRLQRGGKVLFCGNGGSAADAQHLAAELSGRFYIDRAPLFAESLTVDTSYLTAVANDYSFEDVFARLVCAKGRKGDVLVAISTSGNSPNVIKALETAKKIGILTVGLTGSRRGAMNDLCRYLVEVPSSDTARIQETHIMVGHVICEMVERELFDGKA